jgi:hypothetical protein
VTTLPLIGGPLDGLEYHVYSNDVELLFPIRRDVPILIDSQWAWYDRAIYRVEDEQLIFDRYEYPGS